MTDPKDSIRDDVVIVHESSLHETKCSVCGAESKGFFAAKVCAKCLPEHLGPLTDFFGLDIDAMLETVEEVTTDVNNRFFAAPVFFPEPIRLYFLEINEEGYIVLQNEEVISLQGFNELKGMVGEFDACVPAMISTSQQGPYRFNLKQHSISKQLALSLLVLKEKEENNAGS